MMKMSELSNTRLTDTNLKLVQLLLDRGSIEVYLSLYISVWKYHHTHSITMQSYASEILLKI